MYPVIMQRQRQPQPQYYTAITQFQDPDRLAKLLELRISVER